MTSGQLIVLHRHVVLDTPPLDKSINRPGLKMIANCYAAGHSDKNVDGLTLLFAHCIGAHKEQWEPTIQHLFELQQSKTKIRMDKHHRIREAWSFDWQNHGDAAVLNREALRNYPGGVSVYEWAAALSAFVKSPRMQGHRVVAVGHSAGAGALMLAMKEFPLPPPPDQPFPFAAVVLVEPAMITRELFYAHLEDRMATMELAVSMARTRKDMWDSREVAHEWCRKRFPWNIWDQRVLKILVEHGLHDVPLPPRGITLKCTREQEAASYTDKEGHFEAASLLGRISATSDFPVHVVWGARDDLIPEFIKEDLTDAQKGRIVASIKTVEGAGHMVVQEQPNCLAQILRDILDTASIPSEVKARL